MERSHTDRLIVNLKSHCSCKPKHEHCHFELYFPLRKLNEITSIITYNKPTQHHHQSCLLYTLKYEFTFMNVHIKPRANKQMFRRNVSIQIGAKRNLYRIRQLINCLLLLQADLHFISLLFHTKLPQNEMIRLTVFSSS